MSTVRIASVHFHPIQLTRSRPYRIYSAPAVTPGGPAVFVEQYGGGPLGTPLKRQACTDVVEVEQGPYRDSSKRENHKTLITGAQIAADLVNEWTRLIHGSKTDPPSYPGVWVVRDQVPMLDEDGRQITDAEGSHVWRDATDEEKKAMWDEDEKRCRLADSNYARAIFDLWDSKIEAHPDFVNTVSDEARAAAEVYGWPADWLRDSKTVVEMKVCQFCTKKIRAATIVCPHCSQVVDYERFAVEQKKRQESAQKHGVADVIAAGVSGKPPQPTKAA